MPTSIQNPNLIFSGISLIFSLTGIALGLIAIVKTAKLKKLNQALFSGKDGRSLEETIVSHSKEIKELDKEIQELFEISNSVHQVAQKGIHKVGLVRFNPFKDIGGDQSFALALLNGKKNGIVISSLHTREGTRIYVKPVIQGDSKKYQLTNEELKAIKESDDPEKTAVKKVN